ncbi:hypothetical protein Bbelb_338980 [Branchiostoma belcheri]|nr:hypothetical protein Bbelb_338980 [Branchiostoma belcheri]
MIIISKVASGAVSWPFKPDEVCGPVGSGRISSESVQISVSLTATAIDEFKVPSTDSHEIPHSLAAAVITTEFIAPSTSPSGRQQMGGLPANAATGAGRGGTSSIRDLARSEDLANTVLHL